LQAGLDRGLDHFEADPDPVALANRARAWIRGERGPLFVVIHLSLPHDWVWAGFQGITRYDHALAHYDEALAIVLAAFAQRSPPIAIVTADHGDTLGEHGAAPHTADLYDG